MSDFMYTSGWHGESAASDMALSFTSGWDSCFDVLSVGAGGYRCFTIFDKISEDVITVQPIEIYSGNTFGGNGYTVNEAEIPNSLKDLRDHFSGFDNNGDQIKVTVNVENNRLTLHGEGDHEMTFIRNLK